MNVIEVLLMPTCAVTGSFPDGDGIKIPSCGVQQCENKSAKL